MTLISRQRDAQDRGPNMASSWIRLLSAVLLLCILVNAIEDNRRTVSEHSVQRAINSLNQYSPTGRTYKNGLLVNVQTLTHPPNVIHRLTLNLETVCKYSETCPREICVIDVQEIEPGQIGVLHNAIQCSEVHSHASLNEARRRLEQEDIAKIEKQIVDQSTRFEPEVQITADHDEKPFVAVKASPKYCPGCPFDLNPTLPALAPFADQVLLAMDEAAISDFKHKLISIVRVSRSVPPNLNVVVFELLMEIGESSCLRTTLIERSQCELQLNLPIKTCLVKFHEAPWNHSSRRIVNNNCTDHQNTVNDLSASLSSNSPLLELENYPVRKIEEEAALKSEFYDQVAQEAQQVYDVPRNIAYSDSRNPQEVESPHHKVVLEREYSSETEIPRFTDKIKEFDEFLKDFDIPIRTESTSPRDDRSPVTEEIIEPIRVEDPQSPTEIEVVQISMNPIVQSIRKKRSSTDIILGGVKPIDVTDSNVQKYANDGFRQFAATASGPNEPYLITIKEATHQVVQGELYKIKVHIGTSTCAKGVVDNCLLKTDEDPRECIVEVWSRPWLDNGKPKIEVKCADPDPKLRAKRSLDNIPVSEKMFVRKLAEKVVEQMDSEDTDDKRRRVTDVLESSKEKQMFGTVYFLTVTVEPTDCSEGDKFATECLDEIPGPSKTCKMQIFALEKKPLQNPKILKVDCRVDSLRFRRDTVLGGAKTISVDDPEVQNFVKLGAEKLYTATEDSYEPFIAVKSATVQIVSGKIYNIEVHVGTSTCAKGETENCKLSSKSDIKKCTIRIWTQPWVDKGNPEVTVNCPEDNRSKRSLRGKNYSQKMLEQAETLKDERLFQEFVNQYDKIYDTFAEKEKRFQIFRKNLQVIDELRRNEQGTGEYGVTEFADLDYAEFKKKLGFRPELRHENAIPLPDAEIPDIKLPTEFDWRSHGVVTPVKDQGSCGSCWAFAVTGNVEGQYAIKHGKLLSLSEQELLDCDKLDSGCNGGLPDTAYQAIEQLGGLELESDYPYEAEDEKCHFNKNKVKVSVVSGVNITSNETQMAQWLVQNGPIAIGINANAMQFYRGGISHPYRFLCNPKNLDHGVLIVGYGIHNYPIFKKTMPYWIIKNSWGSSWGEQGYYRVYRGDGTCGLNQMPTSAIVA